MSSPPVVLAVAGTDSGGAAGLAADLATLGALGCHGACAVTAVTAQDTTGVHGIHPVPRAVVSAQLDAVVADLPVSVVKTGMLGTSAVVRLVAERLAHLPIVVDPVLAATSGAVLGDGDVVRAYVTQLLPRATLATPNLDEARALTGLDGSPAELAARLADLGCAVVVTGGGEAAADWFALPGGPARAFEHVRVDTSNDHGTGCTFASAIAAGLANGHELDVAIPAAAAFVTGQLTVSRDWDLGRGRGPIAHTTTTNRTDHLEETP
ncbi:bifunctional hydroxymethylpyrimidine kinase/phosphomethylpyrimidine kinase [Nocardioides piscis]|uniref:Bifunctional hydroxymethylpyrimidine kinase/phosphomethylpyrimidine kinase n=1 Tax=Nocardioides piscis TaxID=2714938 RepID=A0A6G7YBQ9_9ACTN|nr:bifunctional hydroxymethylpyrimidine kinase/phosphomethylpyrimidine kinase [Nocardioides piscis]QIK74200.1 bifunctional hydroxymethylpyrimidine kinase/phosphomethylpyrimidine kinase [Nocardioides piscis]